MDSQWFAGIIVHFAFEIFPLSQTNKCYKRNFSLWQNTQMDIVRHRLHLEHHISK